MPPNVCVCVRVWEGVHSPHGVVGEAGGVGPNRTRRVASKRRDR